MPGEHGREHSASSFGHCDGDSAFVFFGRAARHQSRSFKETHLVRESASAVDHAVGQFGHSPVAGRCVAECGEQLELHVTEIPASCSCCSTA